MSTIKFGFIGTGNMGSALARAVVKSVGANFGNTLGDRNACQTAAMLKRSVSNDSYTFRNGHALQAAAVIE